MSVKTESANGGKYCTAIDFSTNNNDIIKTDYTFLKLPCDHKTLKAAFICKKHQSMHHLLFYQIMSILHFYQ